MIHFINHINKNNNMEWTDTLKVKKTQAVKQALTFSDGTSMGEQALEELWPPSIEGLFI